MTEFYARNEHIGKRPRAANFWGRITFAVETTLFEFSGDALVSLITNPAEFSS
jgi:hypothetical protein